METFGTVDPMDLEFPERIASFSLVHVEDYDQGELGVQLRYADATRPRAVVDVYVYPITKPKQLSLTHVLEVEMASVSMGMEYVARQKGVEAGEPSYYPFGSSGEVPPAGLGVTRMLSSSAEELLSQAYVAVRDDRFFKVRMTIPSADAAPDAGDYFQEVIDVLQPAIRLRPPVEKPDFGITVYQNALAAREHETCNLAGWLLYGAELLKQIQAGNYRDTFQREFGARKIVVDYWRELRDKGEPCPSEILERMARIEDAGFLREYVFVAYGGGRWEPIPDLRLDAWKRWARVNVPDHDPVVEPGIGIEWRAKEGDEVATPKATAL